MEYNKFIAMEIEEINKDKQKSVISKKLLGVPLIVLIIGVILVAAAVIYITYDHSFTKTINVYKEGGSSSHISISGTGDLLTSVIDCDASGGSCTVQTNDIVLTNDDSLSHSCTLTTTGDSNVNVTYSLESNPVEIPAGESITFNVIYYAEIPGQYPMETRIYCP